MERDGVVQLSLQEKSRILTDNIYGVDIDPQAVEVAQLSLYLKLLEEETTGSARQYTLQFHRPLLPSLAENVKFGNSLIAPDDLKRCRAAFLDGNQREALKPFDWEAEFPAAMKAGGFDCIVGNPPYVRIQTMREWAPWKSESTRNCISPAGRATTTFTVSSWNEVFAC